MLSLFDRDPSYEKYKSYALEIVDDASKKLKAIENSTFKQNDKSIRNEIKLYKQQLEEIKTKIPLIQLPSQQKQVHESLQPIVERMNTIFFQQHERKTIDDILKYTQTFSICPRINKEIRFDVDCGSFDNGSRIILYSPHGGSNQIYQFSKCDEKDHSDCFVIRDCHSGKYLGFSGNVKAGNHLTLHNEKKNDEKNHFKLQFVEEYFYYIKLAHHEDRVLDIYEGIAEDLGKVISWYPKKKEESYNQQFFFIPVCHSIEIDTLQTPLINTVGIPDEVVHLGCYHIRNTNNDIQFEIDDGEYKDNTYLKLQPQNGKENQCFMIYRYLQQGHEDCFLIKACHSGKFIGHIESTIFFGKKRYLYQTNFEENDPINHWNFIFCGEKKFKIFSEHSKMVVDSSEMKKGTQPYLADIKEVDDANQLFELVPVNDTRQTSFQQRMITHLIHF